MNDRGPDVSRILSDRLILIYRPSFKIVARPNREKTVGDAIERHVDDVNRIEFSPFNWFNESSPRLILNNSKLF